MGDLNASMSGYPSGDRGGAEGKIAQIDTQQTGLETEQECTILFALLFSNVKYNLFSTIYNIFLQY